jgi:hypothetical protein
MTVLGVSFKHGGYVEWHPGIRWALEVIPTIWHKRAPDVRAVITSAQDSTHSSKSFHYGTEGDARCRAVDLRSKNIPHGVAAEIIQDLREQLGPHFDVLYEGVGTDNEHIHIELDMKV